MADPTILVNNFKVGMPHSLSREEYTHKLTKQLNHLYSTLIIHVFHYLDTIQFSVQASSFQGDCYLPTETIIKYRVYSNSHSSLHSRCPSAFSSTIEPCIFFFLTSLHKCKSSKCKQTNKKSSTSEMCMLEVENRYTVCLSLWALSAKTKWKVIHGSYCHCMCSRTMIDSMPYRQTHHWYKLF